MFNCSNKKIALLMGNTYKGTKFKNLPCCEHDVEKIGKLLVEKLDFKQENVSKRINVFPEQEIVNFLKNVEENDLVFIYFSGHGGNLVSSIHVPKNVGLLSSWINPDGTYFLSYHLDILLSHITKKCKIILCSDSCYAGKFLSNYFGKNEIYFIGSSDVATQTSNYESSNTKYGALTLLFDYLLSNFPDIHMENIKKDTEEFRTKRRFLKYLTLIHKN